MKKIMVYSSILFLITGVLAGCAEEEKRGATAEEQLEERAETLQEKEGPLGPAEQEREERIEPAQVPEFVGREVISSDDQALGTITDVRLAGEDNQYVYVFIQGEAGKLFPVPTNFLEEKPMGGDWKASFDQKTLQQAPSFSKAEKEKLSDSQLEEVRSYYGKKAKGEPQKSQ